jgi:hypothetical protein
MPLETRAQVITAILTKINGMTFSTPINNATTWVTGPSDLVNPTVAAKLRLWGDVDPSQQPAVFLVEHTERDEYHGLGVLRRRLQFRMYCYSRSDNTPGGPQLNTMLEAFEAALLKPDNYSTNCNTLGGLVYWTRIEGSIFKDPGDIDNQTLMVVPLVVEMP